MEKDRESTRRQETAFERDWTKGSTVRNLLGVSWPMVINEGLWAIGFTIDMIWVGKLGAAPIAAVGVAGIVVMIIMTAIFVRRACTRAMIDALLHATVYVLTMLTY